MQVRTKHAHEFGRWVYVSTVSEGSHIIVKHLYTLWHNYDYCVNTESRCDVKGFDSNFRLNLMFSEEGKPCKAVRAFW